MTAASPVTATGAHLTYTELAAYRQDGYCVRRAVFSAAELDRLRAAVEAAANVARELASRPDSRSYLLDGRRFVDHGHHTIQFEYGDDTTAIKVIEPVHDLVPELQQLVRDPRLCVPMQQLLGSESLALWTAKLNLKRPGIGTGFGWHQDSPYWVHDCAHSVDQLPNVMVALDAATVENGCLRVIRGSHRGGCLPGTADGSQLGGFYTDPACFDVDQQVALEVPAGSLVFFDPHIVHGSRPNTSDQARRALVVTVQPGGYPALKSRRVEQLADT